MPKHATVVIKPLWKGIGENFASLQAAEDAWRSMSMQSKMKQWDAICEAESPSTLQKMLLDVVALGNDVDWLPSRAAGLTMVIRDVTMSGT